MRYVGEQAKDAGVSIEGAPCSFWTSELFLRFGFGFFKSATAFIFTADAIVIITVPYTHQVAPAVYPVLSKSTFCQNSERFRPDFSKIIDSSFIIEDRVIVADVQSSSRHLSYMSWTFGMPCTL